MSQCHIYILVLVYPLEICLCTYHTYLHLWINFSYKKELFHIRMMYFYEIFFIHQRFLKKQQNDLVYINITAKINKRNPIYLNSTLNTTKDAQTAL